MRTFLSFLSLQSIFSLLHQTRMMFKNNCSFLVKGNSFKLLLSYASVFFSWSPCSLAFSCFLPSDLTDRNEKWLLCIPQLLLQETQEAKEIFNSFLKSFILASMGGIFGQSIKSLSSLKLPVSYPKTLPVF